MVECCEKCGHPLNDFEVQIGLTPRQRDIFRALQKAGRRGLTISQLVEKVYGNDPDGGPLSAANVMHVSNIKMRKKLAKFGFKITSNGGHGAIWRLEKL